MRRFGLLFRWGALGALTLAVAACSTPDIGTRTATTPRPVTGESAPDQPGTFKVGEPYQINGVWYTPAIDYDYRETGIASWYGPGFHGKPTANGEIFDAGLLTAAHRTLPMPSMVRVTNLENGRQITLRVNDRGPFSRGRIIDVSSRAADLLDFKGQGVARVRVEVLEDESRRLAAASGGGSSGGSGGTATVSSSSFGGNGDGGNTNSVRVNSAPSTSGDLPDRVEVSADAVPSSSPGNATLSASLPQPDGQVTFTPVERTDIYIQAGSFIDYDNATRLQETLDRIARTSIEPATVRERRFYRVRLGPLRTVEEADRLLALLVEDGHRDARVFVD